MDDMMQDIPETFAGSPDVASSKRETVVGALDRAADRLHEKADNMQGGRLAGLTNRTANALDATGRYLRDVEARDVVADLGEVAKRHPGKSLIAAVALGFLFGRALSRPQA